MPFQFLLQELSWLSLPVNGSSGSFPFILITLSPILLWHVFWTQLKYLLDFNHLLSLSKFLNPQLVLYFQVERSCGKMSSCLDEKLVAWWAGQPFKCYCTLRRFLSGIFKNIWKQLRHYKSYEHSSCWSRELMKLWYSQISVDVSNHAELHYISMKFGLMSLSRRSTLGSKLFCW